MLAALLFLQAATSTDGMKALEEGRYEAAAQSFRQATASDPADYAAHFNLALAYSFLEKDTDAIAEYRKVLELKPGLYEAELNQGILLLRQKRPADAIPLLEAAVAQKPKEFRPRYYLAESQSAGGKLPEAVESYRAALELDGKSAGAQLGMGRALARQEKLAEAAPYFRAAAQLDAAFHDSLLELAALYEKAGQKPEAVALYRQFSDNPAAQEHLGALLLDSKQYPEAVPVLEEAYTKSPTEANRVALAIAYVFTEQPEKAGPLLEKAVAEEPANFDLRIMYAHALRDRKQYQQAAQQFSAALKLKPDAAHTWDELGSVLYLAEDSQAALAAFERAHQLGENTSGNWFLRAIILDKAHQLKPALEAYRQFLALSENRNPDQEWQARQRVRILERELERK
ncbi:MAG: tetratricopeptide repeat protein [Acidobacteriia bacterium]|nr:tetratricopeptide repeat protein [Terriglobia bacterium]